MNYFTFILLSYFTDKKIGIVFYYKVFDVKVLILIFNITRIISNY